MLIVVRVRKGITPADVYSWFASLPAAFAGNPTPGTSALVDAVKTRLAYIWLVFVRLAFIAKSNHGVDWAGDRWVKQSRKYLAYGRGFGLGEKRRLKTAAGLGFEHRFGPGGEDKGLLSPDQLKYWR